MYDNNIPKLQGASCLTFYVGGGYIQMGPRLVEVEQGQPRLIICRAFLPHGPYVRRDAVFGYSKSSA